MNMALRYHLLFVLIQALTLNACEAQRIPDREKASQLVYTQGTASRDGIGKYYHGREIARVMGHLGARWLERPERDREENTTQAIENLELQPDFQVADIGAGTGYYAFRIAKKVPEGKVYAVDIQPEMIEKMQRKKIAGPYDNVQLVRSDPTDPKLPENTLDVIIIVDVYHELSHPREVMQHLVKALKPDGKLVLLEYRMEDPAVPIKLLHKMSVKQATKEMEAVGLYLEENRGNLPWQHFMVFKRK